MQHIANSQRVQAALGRELGRRVQAVVDVLEQGGDRVAKTARRNHPRLISGPYPNREEKLAIKAFHETVGRFTTRTGHLKDSIVAHDAVLRGGSVEVDIVASTEYAEKVEQQYPYLYPAFVEVSPSVVKALADAMKG